MRYLRVAIRSGLLILSGYIAAQIGASLLTGEAGGQAGTVPTGDSGEQERIRFAEKTLGSVKEAFLSDGQRFLAYVGQLSVLNRNSLISELLRDKDLIFAQDLLSSNLIRELPRDLVKRAVWRASRDDPAAFADWLEAAVLNQSPEFVETLLSAPVSTGIEDTVLFERIVSAYLRAAATSASYNHTQINLDLIAGIARVPGFEKRILEAGLVPAGEFSSDLGWLLGMKSVGNDSFLSLALPDEVRLGYIRGVAESGRDISVQNEQEAKARLAGDARHAVASGAPDEQSIGILKSYLANAEPESLSSLVDGAFKGSTDPEYLIGQLNRTGDPAFAPLLTRLIGKYSALDPVRTSEILANMNSLPDEAIVAFIREIRDDPEAALVWSRRIADPAVRKKVEAELSSSTDGASEGSPVGESSE